MYRREVLEVLADGDLDQHAAADRIVALFAPDESVGDVIAAEPDGTIVLDDGITTWNPRRACEFLLVEQRRRVRDGLKPLRVVVEDGEAVYDTHPDGDFLIRSDVLRVIGDAP